MHISVFIKIENHLHRPQDKYLRDKDLQDATLDALVQEPAFCAIRVYADRGPLPESGQWISISTQGYAVRLDGQVSSLYHRRLAEVICGWVNRSCDVCNHLRVLPAEHGNDDKVSDALRLVLEKDPPLYAGNISTITHGEGVTLESYVHDLEQRRRVVYGCWCMPGVHDVKDGLRLSQ